MEMDQAQRRDIDGLLSSHISLIIDEERGLESPYHYTLSDIIEGNNWVIDDGFVKQSLVAEDRITFNLPAFDGLEQKNITKVELHLTVSSDFAILKTVTLSNGSVENGLEFDEVFEDDMLLDCGLFNFDNLNDVFNAESILTIGLDGNNNPFRLSSAELYIYHEDVLQEEIDTVENRLNFTGALTNYVQKSNGANTMTDSSAYSTIGTSANATQKQINAKIDEKLDDIYDTFLCENLLFDESEYVG